MLIPQPGRLHFPSSPPGDRTPQSQTTVPRMALVQFLARRRTGLYCNVALRQPALPPIPAEFALLRNRVPRRQIAFFDLVNELDARESNGA